MTSPLYSIPNRDAEIQRSAFWEGVFTCLFALMGLGTAAFGLSLVLERARGWMWS